MVQWRKLGHLFTPAGEYPWMAGYAAVPFAEHIAEDVFRIYFSARDRQQRSHTGWVCLDLRDGTRPRLLSPEPVLAPGGLGCFDDSGAMQTWITTVGQRRYLYYIGWNLGVTVPFRNAIGLAISESGGPFVRYAPGPIVDRSAHEPHFVASCCVLHEPTRWRMWYVSCVAWERLADQPHHRYHLKYAESQDGIHWQRTGQVAVDFQDPTEYAISRPSVLYDAPLWRMWYSYRGAHYRIGYAESADGRQWVRRDDLAGLDVSPHGWDAEMVAYPHVFDHAGQRYMLYNGNGYGRTGFGLAVLE